MFLAVVFAHLDITEINIIKCCKDMKTGIMIVVDVFTKFFYMRVRYFDSVV